MYTSPALVLSCWVCAQGLCVYLEKVFGDAGKARGVVIGYDHRAFNSLNSEQFAILSAAVLMSRGFVVHLYNGFVSTPSVVRGTWFTASTRSLPAACTFLSSLVVVDEPVVMRMGLHLAISRCDFPLLCARACASAALGR